MRAFSFYSHKFSPARIKYNISTLSYYSFLTASDIGEGFSREPKNLSLSIEIIRVQLNFTTQKRGKKGTINGKK